MVSCGVYVLVFFFVFVTHVGRGDELSREEVLSWFRERVLQGLDLEEAPGAVTQDSGEEEVRPGAPRISRTSTVRVNQKSSRSQETTQVIVFPSSDSSCAPSETTNTNFTYEFKPSLNSRQTLLVSAHFWFYAGEEASSNSSTQLFILTSAQELLQAAESVSTAMSSEGWLTFDLNKKLLLFVAEGSFLLQVRCEACECHENQPDKMPFLHLHTRPRGPVRSPRQAPVTIPWSPSAIDLLQRPSQEGRQHGDCHRAEIQISFQELGWDNWIVHPEVLTFYYCHGNCTAWDGASAMLGITQCCAPTPGTMRSLRITTTSDGGYSYKYETLPNIIPEECTCI